MNKYKLPNILALGLTLAVLATTGACTTTSVQTPPVIEEFTVTSPQINSGESATLAWKVTNATVVSIDQGIGNVSAIGTNDISPTKTTTYILTASNKYGIATKALSIIVIPESSSEQQTSPSGLLDVLTEMARCRKVLQETPTQPVDANNDGVIDFDDALALTREANDHFDKKIQPLFDKAGIKTDEQGNIITPDFMGKLREKLSAAELGELTEAINKWYEYDAKICATTIEAAQREK
jgi:hypothetical protein